MDGSEYFFNVKQQCHCSPRGVERLNLTNTNDTTNTKRVQEKKYTVLLM